MNRREILAGIGGAIGIGSIGGTGILLTREGSSASSTEYEPAQVPEDIERYRELTHEFHQEIADDVENPRVFLTNEGHIVLDYDTRAKSESELETEFAQIASRYVSVIEDGEGYDPTTLSIATGGVQAILPRPVVVAYLNDEIQFEAMLETLYYTDAPRQKTEE